jgi:hypothetical protein
MSREYLLKVFFDKAYTNIAINKFFTKWCGRSQILRIGSSAVMCEMGCSGGITPEDMMNELYKQLIKVGFKVSRENIIAWSLHPDNVIHIDKQNVCPRDCNNRHRWEKVGCDKGLIIYQCSQCRKCAFENIEILGSLKDV